MFVDGNKYIFSQPAQFSAQITHLHGQSQQKKEDILINGNKEDIENLVEDGVHSFSELWPSVIFIVGVVSSLGIKSKKKEERKNIKREEERGKEKKKKKKKKKKRTFL